MGSWMGEVKAAGGIEGDPSGAHRRENPRRPPGPAPSGPPTALFAVNGEWGRRQAWAMWLRRPAAASSSGPDSTIRPASRAASV